MLIIVFLSTAAVKFKVDDFFIDCVEKLGGNVMATVQQKFDGGITGQSMTSTPWKFDTVH